MPLHQIVYQQPTDLVLGVVRGGVTLPVSILARDVFDFREWRLLFNIIGESHLVQVLYNGTPMFQELLACTPVAAEYCLHRHSFTQLNEHHFEMERYSVRVHFNTVSGAAAPNEGRAHPLLDETDPHALEVRFPDTHGQTPVTRIAWGVMSQRLIWATLHVYPSPDGVTYVSTVSHLKWEVTPVPN